MRPLDADLRLARPGEPGLTHTDAIAQRLAVAERQYRKLL